MDHIVSFSTGLSSALTVEKVLSRYGSNDVHVVFMDTLIEDDDNYRFMRDCETRWLRVYGKPITKLTEGRTPYQVFTDEHVIPNSLVAPCTRRLKINVFVNYLETCFSGRPITIHIGYDYSELHRCKKTKDSYAKFGWDVDFPLLWKPIESRDYSDVVRDDWCIEPPRMYSMSYSHANCGGRCVKQGRNDWIKTLRNFPERYEEVEGWERQMRLNDVNANYTIASRVKRGVKTPITLQQLRDEYQSQSEFAFDDIENEMCVVCGIGDAIND